MLRGIGQPVDVHEIDDDYMRAAIEQVAEFIQSPGEYADLSA
jgi:hypothetical protein